MGEYELWVENPQSPNPPITITITLQYCSLKTKPCEEACIEFCCLATLGGVITGNTHMTL